MVLIFLILVTTWAVTYFIPAGEYEREKRSDGYEVVKPGTFKHTQVQDCQVTTEERGSAAPQTQPGYRWGSKGECHLYSTSESVSSTQSASREKLTSTPKPLLTKAQAQAQALSDQYVHPFDVFVAIPKGLIRAAPYLFIVFIAGGLFFLLQITGSLEAVIGVAVRSIGAERKNLVIVIGTFIYGFFGVAVGFENNIALVPIAILIASAIRCNALVGTTMAVGGIGIGFALSPINPYTVGVAQDIAKLETFSGAGLRTALLLCGLTLLAIYICVYVTRLEFAAEGGVTQMSKELEDYQMTGRDWLTILVFLGGLGVMLYGVFQHKWYINEIAGLFILMALGVGFVNRIPAHRFVDIMMEGAKNVTPGALIIGLAASIEVILSQAGIIDTIVNALSALIEGMSPGPAAVIASCIQGVINLFIPSGSGQAMITMPVLIPLAQLIKMEPQLMITAFQVGDGLTNLIVPTSGGTLAMLALGGVSYRQWIRAVMPYMVIIYIVSWITLMIGEYINYH